jgi:hypothetical protein
MNDKKCGDYCICELYKPPISSCEDNIDRFIGMLDEYPPSLDKSLICILDGYLTACTDNDIISHDEAIARMAGWLARRRKKL